MGFLIGEGNWFGNAQKIVLSTISFLLSTQMKQPNIYLYSKHIFI